MKRSAWFWAGLSVLILISRLCHTHVLWADEDYHLAGAIQVLYGKIPYRDFWYDKPPLNLLFYVLFGAHTGIVLRIADSAFVLLCCALAYRFAAKLWSEREGLFAAAALGFFSIFYIPSANLPMEPDTLMIAPHLAAVYFAWQRKPFVAGALAGVAFLLNTKALLVLAACALFEGLPLLALGFLAPNAVFLAWMLWTGALPDYWAQVWRWGFGYISTSPSLVDPEWGFKSLLAWIGFHAALAIGAVWFWLRGRSPERLRMAIWLALSLIATAAGWRFAPRYMNQLLPALVLAAAYGFTHMGRAWRIVAIVALLIPVVRFSPRYLELARDDLAGRGHSWSDVAMDQESRAASRIVLDAARPGDTIFIWGYRPNLIAYTRLAVAGRLWDSQPVTGVPADRHLVDAEPVSPEWARENRRELIRTKPTFIVDGLSLYNGGLDIHRYPDLAEWLRQYCVVGSARLTTVYRLCGEQ
jgi:hypothetical protein